MENKEKAEQETKGHMCVVLLLILIHLFFGSIPSQAHSSKEEDSPDKATQVIRNAAHATDDAWEKFHAAAIEGTLASPLVQVTIEGQLHKARGLLMQARLAKRSQSYQTVRDLTDQIKEITQDIIQASRERKQ